MSEENINIDEEVLHVEKEDALESVKSFDTLIKFVDERLLFRGLTLQQWYAQVTFPPLSEVADKEEILKLNAVAVKYSEIIYKNVSIAKATLNSAKAKYTSNIQMYKVNFLDNLEAETKRFNQSKRAPAADILEARAHVHCKSDFQTLTLAEIVYDFWKFQVDKLQLFNTRLTSLNISKHNDDKYSNQM